MPLFHSVVFVTRQASFPSPVMVIHFSLLSSEAEHSEAEPQAVLSMSGHMVGVLAWQLKGAFLPKMEQFCSAMNLIFPSLSF